MPPLILIAPKQPRLSLVPSTAAMPLETDETIITASNLAGYRPGDIVRITRNLTTLEMDWYVMRRWAGSEAVVAKITAWTAYRSYLKRRNYRMLWQMSLEAFCSGYDEACRCFIGHVGWK